MPLKTTHDRDEVIARRRPKKTRRPNARKMLESDILNQVRNAIDDALLLHAPESWPDKRLDQIEKLVLESTKTSLAASTDDQLRSTTALQSHITQAVAETKYLIQNFQKSLRKWLYADDPKLTTLPIMLTLDKEDWATIDAAIRRLRPAIKNREHFVERAVAFAIDSLREEAAAVTARLQSE